MCDTPITPTTTRKYAGSLANGLPNGNGIGYVKGAKYTGNWVNGYAEGRGCWEQKNGEKYVGEFSKGFFNGEGHYEAYFFDKDLNDGFQECCLYTGNFKDGCFHGQGTVIYYFPKDKANTFYTDIECCDYYAGEFKNEYPDGKGTYKYKDGSSYVGRVSKDRRCGMGQMYNKEGQLTYNGKWKDGLMHGYGIRYFENGSVHTGKFVNDKPCGSGTRFDLFGFCRHGRWEGNRCFYVSKPNLSSTVPKTSALSYVLVGRDDKEDTLKDDTQLLSQIQAEADTYIRSLSPFQDVTMDKLQNTMNNVDKVDKIDLQFEKVDTGY